MHSWSVPLFLQHRLVKLLFFLNPNFQLKLLARFCDCTSGVVWVLVGSPEDWFSHDVAHMAVQGKCSRLQGEMAVFLPFRGLLKVHVYIYFKCWMFYLIWVCTKIIEHVFTYHILTLMVLVSCMNILELACALHDQSMFQTRVYHIIVCISLTPRPLHVICGAGISDGLAYHFSSISLWLVYCV